MKAATVYISPLTLRPLGCSLHVARADAPLTSLRINVSAVLTVFGAWAIVAGLIQLANAIRRPSFGYPAKTAMLISGGLSAVAGIAIIEAPHAATSRASVSWSATRRSVRSAS